MHIKVLGSGGYITTPRPTCHHKICVLARSQGAPYRRRGPAFYVKEISGIIDTPEDIAQTLNDADIRRIQRIFYSHWHPDHTLGFRLIEFLNQGKRKSQKPIETYIPSYDLINIKKIIPGITYLISRKYATVYPLDQMPISINHVRILPIRLAKTTFSAYLLTHKKKRALICPDHAMYLPTINQFKGIDLLIMNMGLLAPQSTENKTTFVQDNLRIIGALKPRKTILSHIDEPWHLSPRQLQNLQRRYRQYNFLFAADGMDIEC